jgi:hypothetical protein
MRLVSLLFCLSTLGFAETWSGFLVDSHCYSRTQFNVSQDANYTAGRDMRSTLQQCAATPETKKFAIVRNDWSHLKLDAAGNERAASIVRRGNKSELYCVTVAGSRMRKNVIATRSVAVASVRKRP